MSRLTLLTHTLEPENGVSKSQSRSFSFASSRVYLQIKERERGNYSSNTFSRETNSVFVIRRRQSKREREEKRKQMRQRKELQSSHSFTLCSLSLSFFQFLWTSFTLSPREERRQRLVIKNSLGWLCVLRGERWAHFLGSNGAAALGHYSSHFLSLSLPNQWPSGCLRAKLTAKLQTKVKFSQTDSSVCVWQSSKRVLAHW